MNTDLEQQLAKASAEIEHLRELLDTRISMHHETEALLDVQLAGHALSAKQSTKNLLRANAAEALLRDIAPGFKSAVHFVRNVAMDMARDYPEIAKAEAAFARFEAQRRT